MGRGCAFITYSAQEDAQKALRRNHFFKGQRLKVVPARPKEDKGARRQENFGTAAYGQGSDDTYNSRRNEHDKRNGSDHSRQENPSQGEVASQLTDMFLKLIQSQGQK